MIKMNEKNNKRCYSIKKIDKDNFDLKECKKSFIVNYI